VTIEQIKESYRSTNASKLLEGSDEEKILAIVHLLEIVNKLEERTIFWERRFRLMENRLWELTRRLDSREMIEGLIYSEDRLFNKQGGNT
jgi:hypothetical protein